MPNLGIIEEIKHLPENAINELIDFVNFLKFKTYKIKELTKQEKLEIAKKTKGLWANDKNIEEAFKILDKEWKNWKIQEF